MLRTLVEQVVGSAAEDPATMVSGLAVVSASSNAQASSSAHQSTTQANPELSSPAIASVPIATWSFDAAMQALRVLACESLAFLHSDDDESEVDAEAEAAPRQSGRGQKRHAGDAAQAATVHSSDHDDDDAAGQSMGRRDRPRGNSSRVVAPPPDGTSPTGATVKIRTFRRTAWRSYMAEKLVRGLDKLLAAHHPDALGKTKRNDLWAFRMSHKEPTQLAPLSVQTKMLLRKVGESHMDGLRFITGVQEVLAAAGIGQAPQQQASTADMADINITSGQWNSCFAGSAIESRLPPMTCVCFPPARHVTGCMRAVCTTCAKSACHPC